MFLLLPAALILFAFGVSAAPGWGPARPSRRDVWVPPIIEPHENTVWCIGCTVTVTWNTSTRPARVTNPKGTLVLGFLRPDGEGVENLDNGHPLAKGFSLEAGEVEFVVPNVVPKDNYIVALIGDSGNISPKFIITDKE
ncbi:hypothetical protein B0F90DRAFT_1628799 [Multifurca ochricompacta]|uniref:Uncharacterized protein n=1 Tax=Multifurca ochricompacta TaxID=376703 RepID=A0AAD4QNM7_9AGAM|nr:hypothetical protein B0F90DRAFT_1628799 [Multifurca ochricompacta]